MIRIFVIDSKNIIHSYSYNGCETTSPIIRPVVFETEDLIRTGTFQRKLSYEDEIIYIDSSFITTLRVVTRLGGIGFIISSLIFVWNIYIEKVKKK